jgi:hypothetical protein
MKRLLVIAFLIKQIDPYLLFFKNISLFNDRVVPIRGDSSEILNLTNDISDITFIKAIIFTNKQ